MVPFKLWEAFEGHKIEDKMSYYHLTFTDILDGVGSN